MYGFRIAFPRKNVGQSVGLKKKVEDLREKGKEKTPEAWTLLTTRQVVCVCFLPMFLTLEISEQL